MFENTVKTLYLIYVFILLICPKLPAGHVYVNLMFQISSPVTYCIVKEL